MSPPPSINIYLGGSFDPVHQGHVAILQHVYQQLVKATQQNITAQFLPTSRSPLKQTASSPHHRFAMLRLVTDDLNQTSPTSIYTICEQEIWQTPPTYTIDTLTTLREKNPYASLVFIMGADNIANLPQWREGEQLTRLAHIWILPRDKWQSTQTLKELLPDVWQTQVTTSISDLKSTTHGRIYIDTTPIAPIASRDIRAAIRNEQLNQAKSALPSSVYSYIMKNKLYQHTELTHQPLPQI